MKKRGWKPITYVKKAANLQIPNTVTMEPTENTGIVAPDPITQVPPFEDILPDLLGVGKSEEIDKQEEEDVSMTALEQIKEEIRKQGERQVRALQQQTKQYKSRTRHKLFLQQWTI